MRINSRPEQSCMIAVMRIGILALVWASVIPIVLADTTSDIKSLKSLFRIRADTDADGGCKSRLSDPLARWLSESRAMVSAGRQALDDAKNPSASTQNVAKRYLKTYFRMTPDDTNAMSLVQSNLDAVNDFLNGKSPEDIPYLFCNDEWLTKLERSEVAWDTDGDDIFEIDSNGVETPVSIENIPRYKEDLWTEEGGQWLRNGKVPYWSEDMKQYLFDDDYKGKTYCTETDENLGVTQEQITPSSITLCPSSFENKQAVETLGAKKPARGISIIKFLPRSVTFYHELFHLTVGNDESPDTTYSWVEQQMFLKKATTIPDGEDRDYQTLIRKKS